MKEKKLLYIIVTIAIVILALAGVTYGYFVLRMNGTAANAKVTTARVGTVTFQAEDIDTGSTTVLPGWVSGAKLLQIGMSASDVDADYECTMTFTSRVPDLYLKVENVSGTSANSTYTNYTKINSNSVVLSSGTLIGNQTDKVNYYLQFKETGLDQTSQMGQSIVGTVSCSISSSLEYSNNPTLVSKMLADHPEMLSTTNTEDGSTVRYFSGSNANNWVVTSAAPNTIDVPICDDKEYIAYAYDDNFSTLYNRGAFSALSECNSYSEDGYYLDHCEEKYTDECTDTRDLYHYWRIVRTNTNLEEGGVRLIYSGSGALNNGAVMEASNAYINVTNRAFSYKTVSSPTFNYGDETSIINAVNTWYASNIQSINSLVNTKAIYCSDNTINGYNGVFENYTTLDYVTKSRITSSAPSLKCGADENAVVVDASNAAASKYTVDSSTGNGNLVKPIAFLTADEAALAGNGTSWLYYNSNNAAAAYFYDEYNVTTHNTFYLMSYYTINRVDSDYFINYYYYGSAGLSNNGNYDITPLLRPVISLKSNVSVTGGNGSAASPYIIKTY